MPDEPPQAPEGSGAPDHLPIGDAAEAAAAALSRARAAAKARGLRPGLRPRRRSKDVPVSERTKSGRDPKPLGEQLDQFVVERGWAVDVAVGAVIGRWPQIVGPEIALHCTPVVFEEGVLTIRADSTAWATQLALSAEVAVRLPVAPGAAMAWSASQARFWLPLLIS